MTIHTSEATLGLVHVDLMSNCPSTHTRYAASDVAQPFVYQSSLAGMDLKNAISFRATTLVMFVFGPTNFQVRHGLEGHACHCDRLTNRA